MINFQLLRRRRHVFGTGLLFAFCLPFLVNAAEINLSVDRMAITTDEVLRMTVSVNGELDGGVLDVEGLENFEIVGQQTGQQYQNINGQVSVVLSRTVTLQPKKEGEFEIMAKAQADGEEVRSRTARIKVTKSVAQATREKLLEENEDGESEEEKIVDDDEGSKDDLVLDVAEVGTPPKLKREWQGSWVFWGEVCALFLMLGVVGSVWRKN